MLRLMQKHFSGINFSGLKQYYIISIINSKQYYIIILLFMYIYIYICMYVYIYIYIYINSKNVMKVSC